MPTWFEQTLGTSQDSWLGQHQQLNQNPQAIPAPSGVAPSGWQANPSPPAINQDPESIFRSIIGNRPATPDTLNQLEPLLTAAGFRLIRSADGTPGKVSYQGSPAIDVLKGAKVGGKGWQWLEGSGQQQAPWSFQGPGFPPGGATGPTLGGLGGAQQGGPQGVDYTARQGALSDTPGYKFVMGEALGALERSAAAKGTLLTGGHMKELQDRAAGLASMEYNNEFGRNLSLANLGFNAASSQGAYGTAYGQNITDLTTGAGNARAAGTAGAGNAWGNTLNSLGNLGTQIAAYQWIKPEQVGYGPVPNAPVNY